MQPNTLINLLKDHTKQYKTSILKKKYKIARVELDCN